MKNMNLNLNYVSNLVRLGNWFLDIGLLLCLLVLFGHLFAIELLYSPFYGLVTTPQTAILLACLFIAVKLQNYWTISKAGIGLGFLVWIYILLSFFTPVTSWFDNFSQIFIDQFHQSYDSNLVENYQTGLKTKIFVFGMASVIILRRYGLHKLRLFLIYILAFLPVIAMMFYIVGDPENTLFTGFWTMVISILLVYGKICRMSIRPPLRYLIADGEVLKITSITIGLIVFFFVFSIFLITFVENIQELPIHWPLVPMLILWAVILISIIGKTQISKITHMNRKLLKKTTNLAQLDQLTGLNNRLGFHDMVENISKPGRFGIILIDIDHFKNINDKFGHAYGDLILIEVAKVIKQNSRASDFLVRWGGEEFMIFTQKASESGLYAFCEKIRIKIEGISAKTEKLSASFGYSISVNQQNMLNLDPAIELADKALYFSKNNGRNTISKMMPGDSSPSAFK